jgi:hypothetical protein
MTQDGSSPARLRPAGLVTLGDLLLVLRCFTDSWCWQKMIPFQFVIIETFSSRGLDIEERSSRFFE